VLLGRRDGTTTDIESAKNLPSPFDALDVLQEKFRNVNLDDTDLVALQGNTNKHTKSKHLSFLQCNSVYTTSLESSFYAVCTLISTANFCCSRSAHFRQSAVPVHAGELHGRAA